MFFVCLEGRGQSRVKSRNLSLTYYYSEANNLTKSSFSTQSIIYLEALLLNKLFIVPLMTSLHIIKVSHTVVFTYVTIYYLMDDISHLRCYNNIYTSNNTVGYDQLLRFGLKLTQAQAHHNMVSCESSFK